MFLNAIRRALGWLWTQLKSGSGTEGSDCGVVSPINLIDWGSRGKVGPQLLNGKPRPARDPKSLASWVKYLRKIANRIRGAMMVYGDTYQALNSEQVRDAFRAAGLEPLKVYYRYGLEWGELRKWLQDKDHAALVAINYRVARADGALVGSMTFNGGHLVPFVGMQKRPVQIRNKKTGRLRRVLVWKTLNGDSLFDGRTMPGAGKAPSGWSIARFYRYRRAAGAFGTGPNNEPRPIGFGRCIAILVERS